MEERPEPKIQREQDWGENGLTEEQAKHSANIDAFNKDLLELVKKYDIQIVAGSKSGDIFSALFLNVTAPVVYGMMSELNDKARTKVLKELSNKVDVGAILRDIIGGKQ